MSRLYLRPLERYAKYFPHQQPSYHTSMLISKNLFASYYLVLYFSLGKSVFDLGLVSHANYQNVAWREDKHLILLGTHLMHFYVYAWTNTRWRRRPFLKILNGHKWFETTTFFNSLYKEGPHVEESLMITHDIKDLSENLP